MKKVVIGMAIVVMAGVVAAQATVVTIQDLTPAGNDPMVQDSVLVLSTSFQKLTAVPPVDYTNNSNCNYGQLPTMRTFPDTATSYGSDGRSGPRHEVFKFDTSFFDVVPSPLVSSAKFRYYVHPNSNSYGVPAYTNMQLSMFKAGKNWIEGTNSTSGHGLPALDGEVTWNSQQHNVHLWATEGGAGADTDIVSAGTKTFTIDASAHNGELRMIEIDVTDFAQAWADGAENNGMIIWGGSTGIVDANRHWDIIASENLGGESWWSMSAGGLITTDISYRPSLVVEYTPEPASVLLLALGLLPMLRRRRSA